MLKRLVGDAGYKAALDLYFDRHDGQAATIEDWLRVFEDATGRDLTQFKRWYGQAGTPRVSVGEEWLAESGTFRLTLRQDNQPTPGQPDKDPKVIPVAVGLLNPNGDEVVPTTVLELTQTEQAFDFTGLAARPTASILRGFSAPVVLNRQVAARERAFLLAHDTDPFNRWEAGRSLAKEVLMGRADSAPLIEGLARVALDDSLDAAFRALTLRLPGDDDMAATMAAAGGEPDPDEIYAARRRLHLALARKLAPHLPALSAPIAGAFSPTADQAGQRALRLSALGVWARLDLAPLRAAHLSANNMTEEVGTLAHLLENGTGQDEVARFEARWQGERLVMDKWFSLQILCAAPDQAAAVTAKLTQHKLFDWKNPNRFRAVFGALSGNHAGFHHASGAGYALLADWLIKLDPLNPQTAARMSGAYETWARYDAGRQALIKAQLARIAASPGISRNLAEMVARMMG